MTSWKSQQPMDFKWQIARKIDRLDMGEYSTESRFNRLVVIFGLVRAINPKESQDDEKSQQDEAGEKFRSIETILGVMDRTVKQLRTPEEKLKMKDDTLGMMETETENKLDGFWYDLSEVIFRCKITDNVRISEEAAP